MRACLALIALERVFADEDDGMSASTQRPRARPRGCRAARRALAAVQALYQMDLAETDLAAVIEEFKAHRASRERPGDGTGRAEADPEHFAELLAASCGASARSIRWSTSSWPRAGGSRASTPSCARSCAPAPSS